MEGIINSISRLFTTYGFQATVIILLTIVIVNLVKKPIINYAIKYAESSGYDKSVVTKNISFLPFIVSFSLILIFSLFASKFNFTVIAWSELWAQALIYGSVSIATYEGVKKQLEAYASQKNVVPSVPQQKEKEVESNEEILR